ncbi:SDR family oxidoreductase [Deinococcus rubellus]|uniref:SDR family oxidoreductase n=1 Tax=Deinococcus rubellus TaxID=1889240 RepID=UPI0031EB25D4
MVRPVGMSAGPPKTWLITGASSGIGAATARQVIQAGHQVALIARNTERLLNVVQDLNPQQVLCLRADVSDWNEVKAAVEATVQHFGALDVAFANAGLLSGATSMVTGETPGEWREMVLTNVLGAAFTARLCLPELIKSRGHLLLTGSVLGRVAMTGELYSATKWAVTGLAEVIRRELIGSGVRVTLLEPGRVTTGFSDADPIAAPHLQPDDVARAVLYATTQPAYVDVSELLIRPVGALE